MTEIMFLCSACHLRMLYNSMKFHENILNSFQVIEQTQKYNCQISKGEELKKCTDELWFLCSACHLMMLSITIKFNENVLNGFQVIEWTQNYQSNFKGK